HVEPHGEARKTGPRFRHRVDRGGGHDLRAHGAEQIDERDQKIFDAVLFRISPKRRHRASPSQLVMRGLGPRIHVFRSTIKTWMAGTSPAMTKNYFPGIQFVPASGTCAIAADSIVRATRSSGSRLCRCDLPHARAMVCASSVMTER